MSESILKELETVAGQERESRQRRNELVVAATKAGHSRRKVAAAAGFQSPNAVQRIIKTAGLVVTLVLALAGTAGASTPTDADLAGMQTIARTAFPTACSPVTIDQSYTEDSPAFWAWANPTSCTITLDPDFPKADAVIQCSAIVHEYGHLAGYEHSEDPANIMYPVIHPFATCRQLGPRGHVRIKLGKNARRHHGPTYDGNSK